MTAARLIEATDRIWPTPKRRWSLRMKWHDLLFMSWPVNKRKLQSLLPDSLQLDLFDGSAWISIVPFRMTGVAPRWAPDLPWLSSFPELNVRTYVIADGKPGVWFFTLDATNPIAVRVARRLFKLNYVDSRISIEKGDSWIRYSSRRIHRGESPARLKVDYRPIGPAFRAKFGTLDHWLTSRYCLYTLDHRGNLLRGEIDHAPWALHRAQAVVHKNTMLEAFSLNLDETPVSLQFAEQASVVAWFIERVA